MPQILNPFGTDAFNLMSLSEAINILPNNYGKIRNSGLFREKGVTTRSILIEQKNGILNLLPTRPVGSPGTKGTRNARNVRSFTIPHIPHDDSILPQEYDGIRAFGQESSFETLSSIMNDHLSTMKNKHMITLEHMLAGALKGIVYDSDGSTVIYNYFHEFLVKQYSIDFVLGTAGTDIKGKCLAVKRWIEDHLQGEVMNGIKVYVDPTFFDRLTSHAKVEAAYARWRDGALLREDVRSGFWFAGLTFEEYSGKASDETGVERVFIPASEGIAFPLGTQDTFRVFYAPADFLETVNTIGIPLYAKQKERDFNRGVDIHTQSNPLPMCMRPSLIVRLHTSN